MKMIEGHLKKDDLLLNTPYLQQIRGEGHEEGREEGREERNYEIARGMKQRGLATELILELTNLSVEELERL